MKKNKGQLIPISSCSLLWVYPWNYRSNKNIKVDTLWLLIINCGVKDGVYISYSTLHSKAVKQEVKQESYKME